MRSIDNSDAMIFFGSRSRYDFQTDILFPAGNYIFKLNNRNTRTRREISSKLTIKTQERRHWRLYC